MARKKWTVREQVTESLLKIRHKRKWQIALRRYILGQSGGSVYAPYFGLDVKSFRSWIALQFDDTMRWDNFSKTWQFDHIVPVTYFDFENQEDLLLCWNFINIRAEATNRNKNRGNRVDVLAAKSYFDVLYEKTGYSICAKMISKIASIELSEIKSAQPLESFIIDNQQLIDNLASFTPQEFDRINKGSTVGEILDERAFIKKYG